MDSAVCGLYVPNQLESKSSALLFALNASCTITKGHAVFDLKKAQRVFDFIKSNVELPDVKKDSIGELGEACDKMRELIERTQNKQE